MLDTIQSQYANSPRLLKIIQSISDAISPTESIDGFYRMAWSVSSAQGFGLDIWGRIVGIGRLVPLDDPDAKVFGFSTNPQEPKFTPFDVAPFSVSGTGFNAYALPDDMYRKLIMFKAYSNIIHATAPNINKMLSILFDEPAYYLITGPMQARYQFTGKLNKFERMIVYNLQLLPKPCGVEISYEELVT